VKIVTNGGTSSKRDRRRASWRDRARYRFDSLLSRGTGLVILWLGVVTLVLVIVAGVVLGTGAVMIDDERLGVIEAMWMSLLRTLDPGTMGSDEGWALRLTSLVVTMGGIFVVSTLIGLIATGLSAKLDQLRKGRSPVIEERYTLVLGWSSKLFTVLSELAVANQNQRHACVVVMAPRDKVEMEDEIRARAGDLGHTRVVCRTGDPSDPRDLAIVAPDLAECVLVLAPEAEEAGATVVRTVLALMSRDAALDDTRVVAEVPTRQTARALREALGDRITTLVSAEVIGLITAQVCRQAGLGAVYQELLDFNGDEIYFQHEPRLDGRTFAEAALAYQDSTVLGLRRQDGTIELAPPMTAIIGAGDSVIAVSADNDTVVLGELPSGTVLEQEGLQAGQPRPEHILLIGWNDLGSLILQELDRSVAPGSSAAVLVDPSVIDPAEVEKDVGLSCLTVTVHGRDDGSLESIDATVAAAEPDHVVVLCYRAGLTAAQSDARALLTLLQMRQVFARRPALRERLTVVTELLDAHDVPLAEATAVDDFIVSDRLNSLLLTQLAENPELAGVFGELFDAAGAAISLRPAAEYGVTGTMPFIEVVRTGCRRGDLILGYRARRGAERTAVLNPRKSETVTFTPDDELVVLSRRTVHVGAAAEG
jgi:hypothetical protein